jgi:hypothetical protein
MEHKFRWRSSHICTRDYDAARSACARARVLHKCGLTALAPVQQGGGTGPTATAAPSKVPKKAPPRPRTHVAVPMPPSLGRRGSERKPNQRRETALPEELRAELTRKLEKPYVPPTRPLAPEDIAARADAESSGEDDTSDAYYLRLHDAELAKKDEADRAAAGGALLRPRKLQARR